MTSLYIGNITNLCIVVVKLLEKVLLLYIIYTHKNRNSKNRNSK